VPVLLGGAALTRDYAEETLAELYRGPLLYCRDAFRRPGA
jgi:5-methyltetrahydrofolate--homocysteine methyltransferase